MSKFAFFSILVLVCFVSGFSAEISSVGFTDTKGGSGGEVVRVTNLNATGDGSLREALSKKGPRIVVFEVGGVIDLEGSSLSIKEPFLTIAGQTAPSPGITIIRGAIYVQTHDVVVKHIRVRPGDSGKSESDGLSLIGGEAHDVIVDHCSFSWATDENLSASGERTEGPDKTAHRATFGNCIIAEGLSESTHGKGEHSKGSLIHDFCQEIAIVGNLYAHNMRRNPFFKAHSTGVIVNNVVYNPGTAAIQLGYSEKEWRDAEMEPKNCRVSIVGNVLLHGADTREKLPLVSSKGDAYMADNLGYDRNGNPLSSLVWGNVVALEEKPVWPEGLKPNPAGETLDRIIVNVGARPGDRDAVDSRIVKDLVERKGRIIDSQEEVGGYPDPEPTSRKLNIPETGIDEWLEKMAAEVEGKPRA